MKKELALLTLALLLHSCGNKSRQTEPVIYDDPVVDEEKPDTVVSAVQNEALQRSDHYD